MFVIFLCEIKVRKSFAARTAAFDKDKKGDKLFQGSFWKNNNFFQATFKIKYKLFDIFDNIRIL